MHRTSLFWFEFLTLLFVAGAVAGILVYTQRFGPDVTIAQIGPVAVNGYLLVLMVLVVGALLMAFHGWLRQDGLTRRGHVAGVSASADLLRLIVNNPPGTVQEGEKLGAHLTALVEATVRATGAGGAAFEIVEEQKVAQAYAAGSLAPYKGIGANVAGTLIANAVDSTSVLEWNEPTGTSTSQQMPGVRNMLLAPVRAGSRALGVLRVVSPNLNVLGDQAAVVETVGRYIASVMWKAPAVAFEEKEAEKEIGEREVSQEIRARLEQLMDSMDAAVWITDPTSGQILFANAAFERIWARPAEALTRSGNAWMDVLSPEDRKRVERTLPAEPDEPAELTYGFTRQAAPAASIVHRRIPLRDRHRGLIGVGNIATDTSERRGMVEEISSLRRRLSEAMETGPVIAYSARPGGDYGVTFVTPNVQTLLGHGASSFLSDATFWSAHLHPDDQPRVFEGLARLFEKGRLQQEYRFRHADGNYRILLDVARLLRSPEGEPIEIVGYWVDITDRKRLEEGMQYSLNRIKELQESRTRLLNNIAHDLGSPLTPIGLQLHLLRSRDDMPEGARKGLDIIVRNVDHVGLLIQDLKDVARLEAGQLKVDVEPVDAADIVEKSVESFQDSARERGVALKAGIERPLPVSADPQRLNQVMFNFLTNALKFTPGGGTVEIRARRAPSKIVIQVQDSGRGLTREEMDKLFKPFSQVHDRTKIKEKGTGLGLFICKGLIEKHGGQIGVESAGHGHGSTFSFALPLRTGDQATPPPAAPPSAGLPPLPDVSAQQEPVPRVPPAGSTDSAPSPTVKPPRKQTAPAKRVSTRPQTRRKPAGAKRPSTK